MTSYRVVTTKHAKDQLIEIWLSASDRGAVTQAQHRIETTLSHSPRHPGRDFPKDCGESPRNHWSHTTPSTMSVPS